MFIQNYIKVHSEITSNFSLLDIHVTYVTGYVKKLMKLKIQSPRAITANIQELCTVRISS